MATFKRYIRTEKAHNQVKNYLHLSGRRVFTPAEITQLLEENRLSWGFAATTPISKLIDRLIANEVIRLIEIPFSDQRNISRYVYDHPSLYEIALSFHGKSYISHFTAMHLLGLTTQVPKTIYVTSELSKKNTGVVSLTQNAIDHAFSQPQRRNDNIGIYQDYHIVLLNGKHSGRAGVTTLQTQFDNYSYTGLERTLIDITVRPNYSGGAFMVLEAYQKALAQDISINKLNALLDTLSFIYPYQQAIGFYLEKAGFKGKQLEVLRAKISEFDFYLDYQMINPVYSKEWKLYYPKEM